MTNVIIMQARPKCAILKACYFKTSVYLQKGKTVSFFLKKETLVWGKKKKRAPAGSNLLNAEWTMFLIA